jgi:hypothetical protein
MLSPVPKGSLCFCSSVLPPQQILMLILQIKQLKTLINYRIPADGDLFTRGSRISPGDFIFPAVVHNAKTCFFVFGLLSCRPCNH